MIVRAVVGTIEQSPCQPTRKITHGLDRQVPGYYVISDIPTGPGYEWQRDGLLRLNLGFVRG